MRQCTTEAAHAWFRCMQCAPFNKADTTPKLLLNMMPNTSSHVSLHLQLDELSGKSRFWLLCKFTVRQQKAEACKDMS